MIRAYGRVYGQDYDFVQSLLNLSAIIFSICSRFSRENIHIRERDADVVRLLRLRLHRCYLRRLRAKIYFLKDRELTVVAPVFIHDASAILSRS